MKPFEEFPLGRGVYYYIIQITKADMPQVVSQYSVHESTKCSWGVRQPERHALKMVEAPTGAKCRFLLGRGRHAYLPIAGQEVYGGKVFGPP